MEDKPRVKHKDEKMVSMKNKANDVGYSYGTRITLTLEQMELLGSNDKIPPMGLKTCMEATMKVIGGNLSIGPDGKKTGYVEFQITELLLHSPELESEEEMKERTKAMGAESVIYDGPK